MELITGENDRGRRLDRILRKALPDCPLSLLNRLLRKGLILVNGKPAKAQDRLEKGAKISIPRLNTRGINKKNVNQAKPDKPQMMQKPETPQKPRTPQISQSHKPQPQKIENLPQIESQYPKPHTFNPAQKQTETERQTDPPARTEKPAITAKPQKSGKALSLRFFHPPEILWQDQGLIAFNKPAGLAVHGPASMERMVRAILAGKLPPSLSFKPGPLHRLDKPSSGIVVFSASLEGAKLFTLLMREQKIKKTYLAIAEGIVEREQVWVDHLVRDKDKKKTFVYQTDIEDSKIAVTKAVPLARAKEKRFTLITAEIATGRTHQIRAQVASHGHPLAGDRKYGGREWDGGGFFLHAWKMEFSSATGDVKIEAPPPEEFKQAAALLGIKV